MTKDWVHGIHGIHGLLDTGVSGILLIETGSDRAAALTHVARGGSVTVYTVSRAELRKRTGNRQARFAAFRAGKNPGGAANSPAAAERQQQARSEFDLTVLSEPAENGVVFALDQVTDPHNLGAILRTANRFGVVAVLSPKRGSASETDIVRRSSAGTSEHQPHGHVVNLARSLRVLREYGYWIYAAEASGGAVWTSPVSFPVVLVFGSEGSGIRPNVRSVCDASLAIPGGGFSDSLNVSVAAGIFAYEMRRRQIADSVDGN